MAGDFTITVDGVKELDRSFSRFGENVKDISPALGDISEAFKQMESKQFTSMGAFGGTAWQPLSPATIARKPAGLPMMVRSGKLRGALTGGGGFIKRIKNLSMVVGADVFYASYHQRGTRKMPSRLLIKLPESEKMRWMKIIQSFLVKKAREAGL